MALAAGSRIGVYEVIAPLGAGGMGEVYRAKDTRLGRSVALKTLPHEFALDDDRRARFEREAKTLASLNHPHIAQIYGLEEVPGAAGAPPTLALAMELVEGEDVAQRIARGPVPLDETIPLARQIAEGLEAAHEAGIVHRDLKPANIRVTPDGVVKVLDFGLAKPTETGAASVMATHSPTLTSPALTTRGVVLGTASYMAPEQAKGKPVDRRADIWAFGCVLYELLTGRRAFEGEDVPEILGAIIKTEPDWTKLPATTPRHMRTLLQRCLAKDKAQRLQHIGDARLELSGAGIDHAGADESASRRSPSWFASRAGRAVAALALATTGVAAGVLWRPPAADGPRPPLRFTVFPEQGTRLFFSSNASAAIPEPALSPDERWLAFPAASEALQRRLWVRRLDQPSSRELPGTDGAAQPFWWPDSHAIGFFAQGRIKRVAPEGGAVETLCCENEINARSGATVSTAGVVLLAGSQGIQRIVTSGGAGGLETVAEPPEGVRYLHPAFLPRGEAFLFTAIGAPDHAGLYVGWLDGRLPVRIAPDAGRAVYADGHLLYLKGRVLVAQPFDPRTQTLTGVSVALADDFTPSNTQYAAISAGSSGMLAFSPGEPDLVQFQWADRRGELREPVGEPGPYLFSRLSPSGDRIAFDRYDTQRGTRDIWVMQTATGVVSRLTFDPADDANPVWNAAGDRVYFVSNRSTTGIYERRVDGNPTESLVMPVAGGWPRSVSPDGRFLSMLSRSFPWDALALRLDVTDQAPIVIADGRGSQQDAQFAPRGSYVAFESDESGRTEVFVQRFPDAGQRWQVSTAGGSMPRWRADSRELYFVGGDDRLMAVPVALGDTFRSERPAPLFGVQGMGAGRGSYSPAQDGQRFLLAEPVLPRMGISIATNWRVLLPDASR